MTHEIAKAFAESEFEKYRIVQDRMFESDFDHFLAFTVAAERWRRQMRTEYRNDPTVDTADLPYGWHKGDTCVMITNKAKKSTSEYIVESYDGVYFGVRSHTGLYHRVSPWRIFRTKEEAIEILAEQKYGGISL